MTKRWAVTLILVLVVGALVVPRAFAARDRNGSGFPAVGGPMVQTTQAPPTAPDQDNQVPPATAPTDEHTTNRGPSKAGSPGDWFDQMFEWHKTWADEAARNGQLTEEQARAWKQHFDYMKDFHSRYGMPMMGGYGGMMMGGFGYGPGGMMSGYGWGYGNTGR